MEIIMQIIGIFGLCSAGIYLFIFLFSTEHISPSRLLSGKEIVIDNHQSVTCRPTEKTLRYQRLQKEIEELK